MDVSVRRHEKIREFAYTDKDFGFLSQLAKLHTGINLPIAKKELVYGRLAKRLRSLRLTTFREYCEYLALGDAEELERFTNSITTNVTKFFRENHHFEFLSEKIVPELIKERPGERCLRIWSAGCSSGEEPYSIAMALRECIPRVDSWDIKILATDLDSNIVQTAENGIYPIKLIEDISELRRKRWFRKGLGGNIGTVSVSEEIKEMVTFKTLNLTDDWPMTGKFDAIFCRNVIIYFDKPTRIDIVSRYADILKDKGYLFVGHSESLFGANDKFKIAGRTIHRKIAK